MKKQTIFLLTLLASLLFLGACQQVEQILNGLQCTFKLKNAENVALAGVSYQQWSSASTLDKVLLGVKLGTAFSAGSLPLSFTTNVAVENPNSNTATLGRADVLMLIDNKEVLSSSVNDSTTLDIAGKGAATLPIKMQIDLYKQLSGESLTFYQSLFETLGTNDLSRISLKIKPYMTVLGKQLAYPGYVEVKPL